MEFVKIVNKSGENFVTNDGRFLIAVGNKNINIGDYVWTDGKYIFGNEQRGGENQVVLSSEDGIPYIFHYQKENSQMIGYISTKGTARDEKEIDYDIHTIVNDEKNIYVIDRKYIYNLTKNEKITLESDLEDPTVTDFDVEIARDGGIYRIYEGVYVKDFTNKPLRVYKDDQIIKEIEIKKYADKAEKKAASLYRGKGEELSSNKKAQAGTVGINRVGEIEYIAGADAEKTYREQSSDGFSLFTKIRYSIKEKFDKDEDALINEEIEIYEKKEWEEGKTTKIKNGKNIIKTEMQDGFFSVYDAEMTPAQISIYDKDGKVVLEKCSIMEFDSFYGVRGICEIKKGKYIVIGTRDIYEIEDGKIKLVKGGAYSWALGKRIRKMKGVKNIIKKVKLEKE